MDYFISSSVIYTVSRFLLYKKKKSVKLLDGLPNHLNTNGTARWRHRWPQLCLEVWLWPENGGAQADVHWWGGICRPDNFTENSVLQEPHWGDFFLLPLLLLLCFQRTKAVKLQGVDPREVTQAHNTMAVLWGNINLVTESIIAVLGLVLQCRRGLNPSSFWLSEMVIVLPLFLSFFSCPFSLLSPASLPNWFADCLMRAGTATK